jgi:tetratricopeptide (TPR) repeat protein
MMRWCIAVVMVAALRVLDAPAQSVRSLVNKGNDKYKDQSFADAEINYRKALEKEQQLVQGHFNLGNALYKQGKYDEAVRAYDEARQIARELRTKADASYNIGNAHLKSQDPQKAIQAYIDGLKLDPDDLEAKYNLSQALRMLQQQQQQQQQKNKSRRTSRTSRTSRRISNSRIRISRTRTSSRNSGRNSNSSRNGRFPRPMRNAFLMC